MSVYLTNNVMYSTAFERHQCCTKFPYPAV